MQITFYFNVLNREKALCQLVGKSLAAGKTVCVLTESAAATAALDRLLWEVPQNGFVPHCAADDPRAARTPVIVDHRAELLPANDVLFNWTGQVSANWSRHARVIEIVDSDEDRLVASRQRWRAYQALGLQPDAIDMKELPRHG